MSIFARMKIFQKIVIAIFCFFMGMMILVTVVAHTMRSGSTGMDMMKIQQAYQDKVKKSDELNVR